MKHKMLFRSTTLAFLMALTALPFISCSGNDDEPSEPNKNGQQTKEEWYIAPHAGSSDFNEINEAIEDEELLSQYGSNKYYAEPDLFFNDDGWFTTSDPHFGRLRFKPDENTVPTVIHIVDESTIEIYYACPLYRINDVKDKKFKVIDAGNLGTLCYSNDGNPTVFTYVKASNKYILSNGTIYTKTNESLIEDGSSTPLSRFTPDFSYRPTDKPSDTDKDDSTIPNKGALNLDGALLTSVLIVETDEKYSFEYDSKDRLTKCTYSWYGCSEPDICTINYDKRMLTYTSDGDVTRYQLKFKSTGQITYLKDMDSNNSVTLEYDKDKHLQKAVVIDDIWETDLTLNWDKYGRLPSIDFSTNNDFFGKASIQYGKEYNNNGQFSYSLSCALGKDFDAFRGLILAGLFGKAPVREVKAIDGYEGVFFNNVEQYYNNYQTFIYAEVLIQNEYNSYNVLYYYNE